jgi:hypothetical protein
MHMARGGGCTGGEGGCTCILCIPPGYAPVSVDEIGGGLVCTAPACNDIFLDSNTDI